MSSVATEVEEMCLGNVRNMCLLIRTHPFYVFGCRGATRELEIIGVGGVECEYADSCYSSTHRMTGLFIDKILARQDPILGGRPRVDLSICGASRVDVSVKVTLTACLSHIGRLFEMTKKAMTKPNCVFRGQLQFDVGSSDGSVSNIKIIYSPFSGFRVLWPYGPVQQSSQVIKYG